MQNGRPLAYESRRLIPAEVHACKTWRCYLEGPIFTIVTDHNPLVHLSNQPNLSRRQVWWVQDLSRFTFNWVYKPGATNKVADALSRYPPKISTIAVMLLALRTMSQSKSQAHTNAVAPPQPQTENQISPESPGAQRGGEELSDSPPQTSLQGTAHTRQPDGTLDIYEAVTEAYDNEPWFQFEKHTANYIFKDGEWFTQRNQLIVPDMPSIKKSIIHELHSTPIYGHGGFITKTKKQVEKLVWWPSLLKDVTQFVKECPSY